MKKVKLEEIIKFTLGKNSTRLKDDEDDLYTPDDLEKDLCRSDENEQYSECVISLIKSKAAPISMYTQNKCLTSNFLKCVLDKSVLDPWFFCYMFNDGKEIKEQIYMFHQGSYGSVKKLNVKIIGELEITLPDIKKQKIVGLIYKNVIKQYDLMKRQADDMKQLSLEIIKKIEED